MMKRVEDCEHDEKDRRCVLGDLSMEYCGECGMWMKGPLVVKNKQQQKEVD